MQGYILFERWTWSVSIDGWVEAFCVFVLSDDYVYILVPSFSPCMEPDEMYIFVDEHYLHLHHLAGVNLQTELPF
jgi:Ni,Fe-hydrogenase I cytochrome b subunit